MEPSLEKLITDALAREFSTYKLLLVALSAISAVLTIILGSYLKKFGELQAVNKNFTNALKQLETQTEAVESVKAAYTSELDKLKDIRERERSYDQFRRTDVASHVTALLSCTKKLVLLSKLPARRAWVEKVDLASAQEQMLSEFTSFEMHIAVLYSFDTINEEYYEEISSIERSMSTNWDDVVNQLTRKDPAYREQYPNGPKFDGDAYQNAWHEFGKQGNELSSMIGRLPKLLRYTK